MALVGLEEQILFLTSHESFLFVRREKKGKKIKFYYSSTSYCFPLHNNVKDHSVNPKKQKDRCNCLSSDDYLTV